MGFHVRAWAMMSYGGWALAVLSRTKCAYGVRTTLVHLAAGRSQVAAAG